jgi:lipoprotein-anchoring transpeptidase ErfK/SrfK
MGKKSGGKHAANNVASFGASAAVDQQFDAAKFGAVSPAGSSTSAAEKSKARKVAAIAAGIVVGVLLIIYLAGAFLFSGHFLPNTYVAGTNYGLKSASEMTSALDSAVGDYSLHVTGQGLDFEIDSADAQVTADCSEVSEEILTAQNPWLWPALVFTQRDCTENFTDTVTSRNVSSVVQAQVDAFNAQATMPTDASVQYVDARDNFEIISEVWGTALDATAVIAEVNDAILDLKSAVVLTQDVVLKPSVYKDDARLATALETALLYMQSNFDVTLGGTVISTVSGETVAPWVTFGEDFACDLSADLIGQWSQALTSKYTTVGTTRQYTNELGKAVTVSGGSYGWKIDADSLTSLVTEAVRAARTEVLEAPTSQSGNGFSTAGGRDWGARYVDVDLSTQHATFYGSDGSVIWESDIVSGNPNKGYDTPQGVWAVTRKSSPETLIGTMQSDGTPEYETKVQYWMPFKGNSVGFHDASWQSAFGGSRYLTNGSHGCINLPSSAAAQLYSILNVGDVVVVHA